MIKNVEVNIVRVEWVVYNYMGVFYLLDSKGKKRFVSLMLRPRRVDSILIIVKSKSNNFSLDLIYNDSYYQNTWFFIFQEGIL